MIEELYLNIINLIILELRGDPNGLFGQVSYNMSKIELYRKQILFLFI